MWKATIRNNYSSYEQLVAYNKYYNIANRLGYKTTKELWRDNPLIQGSANPEDFKVVKKEVRQTVNS